MKTSLIEIAQIAIADNYDNYSEAARELGVPPQRVSEFMRRRRTTTLADKILLKLRRDIFE